MIPAPHNLFNDSQLIPGSEKDGWRLGLIGRSPPSPWPKLNGDLFVTAPNGDIASIAWESSGPDIRPILGPSEGRWGVFQLRFPLPVTCEDDLIRNFHAVLPLLQQAYATHCAAPRAAED